MDTSRRRFIRLAIVSATAAGVALASPIVAIADGSEVIEVAPTGENTDPPAVAVPTTEPLVIELVIEGDPPIESNGLPSDAQSMEPAEADTTSTATDSELIGADPRPIIATLEMGSVEEHTGGTGEEHTGGTGEEHTGGTGEEHTGGTGEDHTGGTGEDHTGGTGGEHTGGGGTGDPYRISFVVSWRLPDDSTVPVLHDVLPGDWRPMFDLAAASATGGGKPTSAHCTYPPGSTDLVCEFENPGKHSSVTDGMIVPAKPTARYSVTVLWPTIGWTIDGANGGPYSARDLCPRGGHDDEGGHDSGHGETLEAAALEGSGSVCIHTVVIRRSAAAPNPPAYYPPAYDPPAQEPPVSDVPADEPPQSETPAPPAAAPTTPIVEILPVTVTPEATPTTPPVEVLPVTVTPRALPATGNTATTTLTIGAIILALGGCLSVLARRRNDLPLS